MYKQKYLRTSGDSMKTTKYNYKLIGINKENNA